jgi:hypothetical protein
MTTNAGGGAPPRVEIYITHYVTEALPGYNDIAVECASDLLETARGSGIQRKIFLLYWTDGAELEADLVDRMPPGVELVRCRSHVQPHLMNEATRLAREHDADYFVCLHNDIRPSIGWLEALVADTRAAEAIHGRANVVVSPRLLPFHWKPPHPRALRHPGFWGRIRPEVEAKVLSSNVMGSWCASNGFQWNGRLVVSPEESYTTDDGHQLMMYCASPHFFDEIGGCDETFTGLNYGDCDWGIRALLAGKRNLKSQGSLLGHMSGLTFYNPAISPTMDSNHERFIEKWGPDMFRDLQDGSIWPRLHRAQDRGPAR